MNYSRRVKKLEAVYALLPKIACKGLCHTACVHVAMAPIEHERIRATYGKDVLEKRTVKENLDKSFTILQVYGDPEMLNCPALTEDKRCGIYEARPLICRCFGIAQSIQCPHGCEPEGILSDAQAAELQHIVEAI
jgi:Fe-S-cluster containining protein